jgi:hypothetical protein
VSPGSDCESNLADKPGVGQVSSAFDEIALGAAKNAQAALRNLDQNSYFPFFLFFHFSSLCFNSELLIASLLELCL